MTLTFEPVSAELAEVIAMTAERTAPTGQLWCAPQDAQAIRRMVIDRSAALGAGFGQVVRFARLAALASHRSYLDLLYVHVPILRRKAFKDAVERGCQSRRLRARQVERDR